MDFMRDEAKLLGVVFLVVSVGLAVASILLRNAIIGRPSGTPRANRFQAFVVAGTVAEIPGLLGMLHALLSGRLAAACMLWVIAFGTSIYHIHLRTHLES